MKQTITKTLLFLLFSASLFSCAFAPVNNQYEKAGTLKKGNAELSGNYTHYSVSGGGESLGANNNYGFRFGYGISDKFDLKVRYEHLSPTGQFEFDDIDGGASVTGVNYFSVVPKFAIITKKLSFVVPLSYYSYKESGDGGSSVGLGSVAPQILYTATGKTNRADVTFGLKADCLLGGGGGAVLWGLTIGGGFSTDLDKWAIRPEVGASTIGGGAFLSFGVGFQIMIPRGKR